MTGRWMALTPNCLHLRAHHFAVRTVEPGIHRPSKKIAVTGFYGSCCLCFFKSAFVGN